MSGARDCCVFFRGEHLRIGRPTIALVMSFFVCVSAVLFSTQAATRHPQGPDQQGAGANPAGRGGRGGRGGGNPAYPTRPAGDPAVVEHGKQLFDTNCAFCHGAEATGGETGPNLVVSQLVLDDQHGELIAPVVHGGRPDKGMPQFNLSDDDIIAIAEYVHSIPTRGGPAGPVVKPANPLVGDARAGEAYFNGPGKCNTCHSATGDLAGIGAKYDPRTLQSAILSGTAGGGRGFGGGGAGASVAQRTVTVTLASGQKIEGKLDRIDFFVVSLTDANGNYHSFNIGNGSPKVEIHDPLQAHKDRLPNWDDADIHNLTAYLVTLK